MAGGESPDAAGGTDQELGLIYHGVRIVWQDRRRETFRYPSREAAEAAARYQFLENASRVRNAWYMGPRINWQKLLSFGWRR